MANILIVSVHPDDEALGCGGSIFKHVEQGDNVSWLIFTNVSESEGWDARFVKKRQQEIEEVSSLCGFEHTFKLDFPTMNLDQIAMGSLITAIGEVINKFRPEIIYLPNRSDVHSDHRIAFQAAYSCTKNFRYPFIKRILMYECLSETEFAPALSENNFVPNVFTDVTKYFPQKMQMMQIYKSEVMPRPQPRSSYAIEALARLRGSRIGVDYAESFCLLLEIN